MMFLLNFVPLRTMITVCNVTCLEYPVAER